MATIKLFNRKIDISLTDYSFDEKEIIENINNAKEDKIKKPSDAIINCRRILEILLPNIYKFEFGKEYHIPFGKTIFEILNERDFKDRIGSITIIYMNFVKLLGNIGAHYVRNKPTTLDAENIIQLTEYLIGQYHHKYRLIIPDVNTNINDSNKAPDFKRTDANPEFISHLILRHTYIQEKQKEPPGIEETVQNLLPLSSNKSGNADFFQNASYQLVQIRNNVLIKNTNNFPDSLIKLSNWYFEEYLPDKDTKRKKWRVFFGLIQENNQRKYLLTGKFRPVWLLLSALFMLIFISYAIINPIAGYNIVSTTITEIIHVVLPDTSTKGPEPPPPPNSEVSLAPVPISPLGMCPFTQLTEFKWTKVPNAIRYVFEIYKDREFTNIIHHNETSSDTYPLSLYKGNYYWRVKAITNAGETDWSISINFFINN
jgi:hypothetical protein